MTQANQGMWPPSQGALGGERGREQMGEGGNRNLGLHGGKWDQQKEPNTISCQHQRAVGD